ncbi:hypothetical protein Ahy_B09g096010 isoform B [Arachis hypogaea]|uniref:Transposase MuDR plant domain-containing protein n=1 Tax=Arachis hypogaea TaxID=3818 RepID=A0A444XHL7_ARAHY|nr:hypothetical protein Ahy_B09g096010 isoform B [Arachis hypogaea]
MVGKKKITKLTYRMPVAVANSFAYQKMQIKSDQHVSMMFSYHRSIGSIYSLELCVNLQDISGSSSSSNNVEGIRNLGSEDFVLGRDIGRARSPTLNAFVTPEPNTDNCHARPFASNLVAFEGGHHDGMAETSDEDEIKDFSSDEAEVVSETQPLYRETEDRPSNYALSGEMELEIGLKFFNRETAMLAVKNYNIRRSAEYKLVESDQSRNVC